MNTIFRLDCFITDGSGSHEPCRIAIANPRTGEDGLQEVSLVCDQAFFGKMPIYAGDSVAEAAAHAIMILHKRLKTMGCTLVDASNMPVELPRPQEFDPGYPTEEELANPTQRDKDSDA
ncbi:hypothetical protein [Limibacillus sp. MBR-115]|jgi:hypothetical protein|uniref:hypothetical protein n=1 Tax=Limibacillus sp. MBR-115 TaxID=3156465 RepID=UPI003393D521